jgi:tetratricopeptide (TPR) repeat protein
LAHRTAAFAQFLSKRLDLFNGEARAALDLAPNNAELLAQLGALYTFSGHWESGVSLVTKAQRLSPISAAGWYHSALHYNFFRKGQYQQALDIMTMHPGQDQLETEWKYVAAYGALN